MRSVCFVCFSFLCKNCSINLRCLNCHRHSTNKVRILNCNHFVQIALVWNLKYSNNRIVFDSIICVKRFFFCNSIAALKHGCTHSLHHSFNIWYKTKMQTLKSNKRIHQNHHTHLAGKKVQQQINGILRQTQRAHYKLECIIMVWFYAHCGKTKTKRIKCTKRNADLFVRVFFLLKYAFNTIFRWRQSRQCILLKQVNLFEL